MTSTLRLCSQAGKKLVIEMVIAWKVERLQSNNRDAFMFVRRSAGVVCCG